MVLHVTPTAIEETAAEPRRTAWGWVILMALILFLAGSIRLALTPLQQAAQVDIGFSDTEIATLKGLANGLPGFVLAIPLGIAIDHYNRQRLMVFLGLCWAAGALMTPFSHSFVTLFIARALVALGVGSAFGVAASLISDWCAPQKRGRAMIIIGIGVLAGPAFAFAGGGAMYGYFTLHGWSLFPGMVPWRLTTLVFAVISVALLLPVLFLREPQRHERTEHGNAIIPAIRGLLMRWRFVVPLWLGATAGGLAEGGAGLWAAPLLERNYGLTPDKYGAMMGIIILAGGFFGSLCGGIAADWSQKSNRRGRIMLGAVLATIVTIPMAVYPIMPTPGSFGLVLFLLMLFVTLTQVIGTTAITVLIPNEERGVCLALTSMASTLIGFGFAPLVPVLAPIVFGDTKHLADMLAIVGVVTGIIALAGYIVAMRTAPASYRHA